MRCVQELDDIEARVERITVPLSYADELYALRSHINLVRRRLQGPSAAPAAAATRNRMSAAQDA